MITRTLLSLAIAASLTGCVLDDDPNPVSPNAQTEDTQTDGDTDTGAETSTGTTNVASITDTDTEDTGELRYVFDSGLTEGSVSLSVLYAEGETETLAISLFDSGNSTSSLIGELRLDTGEFALRNNNDEDFTLPAELQFDEGEFVDVVMTWNTSSTAGAGSYTVTVNDVTYGPIISENVTPGVEVTALSVRLSSNSATAETAALVDNIVVYSDEASTTEVFSEDFEGYAVGASLTADPFDGRTFSAEVAEIESDEVAEEVVTEDGSDTTTEADADSDESTDSDTSVEVGTGTDTDDGTDSSTDVDADADADAETEVEVTTNNVASITDTDADDTGELRYVFDDGMTEGKVSLSVNYAEGETETFAISLFDEGNSTSSLIGELRLDTGKLALRNNNDEDYEFPTESQFVEGETLDIAMTWNTSVTTEAGTYSVSVNDVSYGPFIAENVTPGVEVTALSLRLSSNSGTAETAVLVDDIAVFSDEAGSTSTFSEDFEGYSVGDNLSADPFNNKTFSAVVAQE